DADASDLGDDVLSASGTATGHCVDRAGNAADASYSAQIDTVPPTVGFHGNAGTYAVDQIVDITCEAVDPAPGSGIETSTCSDLHVPASSLALGEHALSAAASDLAGTSAGASASFVVTVDTASLCRLTAQLVRSSARYQTSTPRRRAHVDARTTRLCTIL